VNAPLDELAADEAKATYLCRCPVCKQYWGGHGYTPHIRRALSPEEAAEFFPDACRAMTEPTTGSVEELLAKVEALPEGTKSFELFVPQDLTMQGRPVAQNMAMALVLDRLLGRGLFPDGFEQRPTGRRYKYK
jgi:hypothetical protein